MFADMLVLSTVWGLPPNEGIVINTNFGSIPATCWMMCGFLLHYCMIWICVMHGFHTALCHY